MKSLGSVEDPSPSAYAERSLVSDHSEGWLSYKATSKLTASWACPFYSSGIDSHMLALLTVNHLVKLVFDLDILALF